MTARLLRACAIAATILATMGASVSAAPVRVKPVSFADLPAWTEDDHEAALAVFLSSCSRIRSTALIPASDWAGACQRAGSAGGSARAFFEGNFQPVMFEDGAPPLFTAYYEPEIPGALRRDAVYRYPLYRVPPELPKGRPWKTRAEIAAGALAGRNLELVWLSDPVEVYFLHVQGSGRIRLPDGSILRVGYAAKNGHPYRSVGKEMARRGLLAANRVTARRIGEFVRHNPKVGREILNHNRSFVFFRKIELANDVDGPLGAMNVSVTAMRSLAVDPEITSLGAPVWVEMSDKQQPLARLMVAQDVGSAIKGAQRGDLFFGSGKQSGERAGRIRHKGRLVVLVPKQSATRLFAAQ